MKQGIPELSALLYHGAGISYWPYPILRVNVLTTDKACMAFQPGKPDFMFIINHSAMLSNIFSHNQGEVKKELLHLGNGIDRLMEICKPCTSHMTSDHYLAATLQTFYAELTITSAPGAHFNGGLT